MSTEENKIETIDSVVSQPEVVITQPKATKESPKEKASLSVKDIFNSAKEKFSPEIVEKLQNEYKSSFHTGVANKDALYQEMLDKGYDYMAELKANQMFKELQEAETLKINTEIENVLKKAGVENLDAVIDEIAISNGYSLEEKLMIKSNPSLLKRSVETWKVDKIRSQPLPSSAVNKPDLRSEIIKEIRELNEQKKIHGSLTPEQKKRHNDLYNSPHLNITLPL